MAKTSNKTMGIFCILLSGLCFTGMNTFVRLSGDLPTMQKVFFRNFVAMIFAFVMMVRKKDSFPPRNRGTSSTCLFVPLGAWPVWWVTSMPLIDWTLATRLCSIK